MFKHTLITIELISTQICIIITPYYRLLISGNVFCCVIISIVKNVFFSPLNSWHCPDVYYKIKWQPWKYPQHQSLLLHYIEPPTRRCAVSKCRYPLKSYLVNEHTLPACFILSFLFIFICLAAVGLERSTPLPRSFDHDVWAKGAP